MKRNKKENYDLYKKSFILIKRGKQDGVNRSFSIDEEYKT